MNKKEFNLDLKEKLNIYLPSHDIEKTLSFFNEIIDDKIEEGISEEIAVSQLGNIENIIDQILEDHNIQKRKTKMVWRFWPYNLPTAPLIALLILASPLLLSVVAIIFSLIVSILAIVGAVVVSIFSFFMWGIYLIFRTPFLLYKTSLATSLAYLGGGMVITGIGVILSYYIRVLWKNYRNSSFSFRRSFVKIFKKEVFINE